VFGAVQGFRPKPRRRLPLLTAATNTSGGMPGKAGAMQNADLASKRGLGLHGRGGDILRRLLRWSLRLAGSHRFGPTRGH
jgi:lactate permease